MPRPGPERINLLYKRSLVIVDREIAHLSRLVREGKLRDDHATDLRGYVKLLADMKKATDAINAKAAKEKSVESEEALASTLESPTKS